jgi:RNA polymerase sigma factor (sigma-70 family)
MLHGRDTPAAGSGAADPAEIVRTGYPRLLQVARRLATSVVEAEDLVQEAFVETLSRYPNFEGLRQPLGYLMTVLYRTSFRRRLLSMRVVPLDLQERLEQAEPDHDAPTFVLQALAELGPKQRACIELRYLYDLDDDEIAAALGCSRSTVRSQIARGLALARKEVGDARA